MDHKTIRDTNNRASEGQSSESKEQQEIKKYRAMIKKIKSQNDLIHQEISSLTRARKISMFLFTQCK